MPYVRLLCGVAAAILAGAALPQAHGQVQGTRSQIEGSRAVSGGDRDAPRQLQKKVMLEGLNARSDRRWQMEWDAKTQTVRQLHSGLTSDRTALRGAGPVERARQFLQDASQVLDLNSMIEMAAVEARQTTDGSLVRFRRHLNGIAVEDSTVSVHMNLQGQVYWVNKQAGSSSPAPSNQILVPEDAARQIALDDLKPDFSTLRAQVRSELVLKETGGALRYGWRIELAANDPLGDWSYLVDAETGTLIEKVNLLRFARARFFNPSPLVTLKDPTLRDPLAQDTGTTRTTPDANCDPNAVPSQAYREVELQGLVGASGRLDGAYVNTAPSGPEEQRARANPDFLYTRCDSRFNEVMVYVTIDALQRTLQGLGLRNVNNRSIPVNANGFIDFGRTQDQSFYSPLNGDLVFGLGGVHDAEDGEIIAHEYGHAIQDNQVPGFARTNESQSIGEGFGDILAALYFTPVSGGFADDLVGEWDATFYDRTNTIPRLRPVQSTKTYNDYDPSADVHRNGTIWAASIWDFYLRLGATRTARDTVLQLLVESQFLYRPDVTFAEAAQALIQTDDRLTGGANRLLLTTLFTERRILRDNSKLPAAQLSEAEPNDLTTGAQSLAENHHAISGTIAANNDVDLFRIRLKPNQLWVIEIYARRLVPPSSLDSVLAVLDSSGQPMRSANGTILENDDITSAVQQDSRLVFLTSGETDAFVRVSSFENETNGSYLLLIYPAGNPLRVPRVASGQGAFTGVALSNPGTTDAIVGLILLDDNGRTISGDNPRLIGIPAGRQIAFLDSEMFGYKVPVAGWLEIHSNSADVKGYFLNGSGSSLLGAEASPRSHLDGIFPLASAKAAASTFTSSTLDTEIVLVNPNSGTATAEITVFDSSGRATLVQPASIGPFGRVRRLLSESLQTPLAEGYVRVRSDRPLAGFELHGDQRKTGLGLRATDESAATLTLAHFAEAPVGGGRLFSVLNLVNPTARRIRVTVAPLDDAGGPYPGLTAAELIVEPGTAREAALRDLIRIPDQTRTYTGSLQIRADAAGLIAALRYARSDIPYMAVVAFDSVARGRMVFSHVADGVVDGVRYLTGVALQNPGPTAGAVTLKVFGADGVLRGQFDALNPLSVLQPGQRLVRLLSELVPNLGSIVGGYVVVESTVPLLGFELIGQADSLIPVPPQ